MHHQFWFPLIWHISFDKCERCSTHIDGSRSPWLNNQGRQTKLSKMVWYVQPVCWPIMPNISKDDLNRVTLHWSFPSACCWILQKFHCTSQLQNQRRTICLEPYEIEQGIWLSHCCSWVRRIVFQIYCVADWNREKKMTSVSYPVAAMREVQRACY